MNAETEKVLEGLIRKFGYKVAKAALDDLIGQTNWSDWQSVNSWLTNTANRIQREKQEYGST